MLGLMVTCAVPSNAWKTWIDYIMTEKQLAIKEAAMVYENGLTAASTSGLHISNTELQRIKQCFAESNQKPESIVINGRTYCVKSCSDNKVVAFNGSKYIMISKSQQMFVLGLCTDRLLSEAASTYIEKIATKLSAKKY